MKETPGSLRLLCLIWTIANFFAAISGLRVPGVVSLLGVAISIIIGFGALYFTITLPKYLQPGHTKPLKTALIAFFFIQLILSFVAEGVVGGGFTFVFWGALTWYLLRSLDRISSTVPIPSTMGTIKRPLILLVILVILVGDIALAANAIQQSKETPSPVLQEKVGSGTTSTPVSALVEPAIATPASSKPAVAVESVSVTPQISVAAVGGGTITVRYSNIPTQGVYARVVNVRTNETVYQEGLGNTGSGTRTLAIPPGVLRPSTYKVEALDRDNRIIAHTPAFTLSS